MKNIFDSVKANKRKVFIGISLVFSMFLIAFASYNVNKLFANLSGDETPINTAFFIFFLLFSTFFFNSLYLVYHRIYIISIVS